MSRTARQYKYASFFHVIVQGIDKEGIFKRERYINEYLKLIRKYSEELNIKIIAYCIMANHAHLLVKTNKTEDISKMMLKVNSIYAKYYNYMENGRVGYVFRDRFVSEPIDSRVYLINCIKYIHMNPVKAGMVKECGDYKFSTFNIFLDSLNKKMFSVDNLTKEDYEDICNNKRIIYEFKDIDKESEKERFYKGTKNYVYKEQIKLWEIFCDRDTYLKYIKYLRNIEKMKYIDIRNNLLMTRSIMDRLVRVIKDENNIAK